MGLGNPFKWAEEQGEKFVGSISDNVGDILSGDVLGGLGGLFENTLDFFTLGAYSKIGQIIDALNPDLPEQTYQGRDQMGTSAQTPKQLIYGRCRVGGQLTYWTTTGTDSEFMHMVVTLAPHELRSISQIYFNEELAITIRDDGDSLFKTIEEKFSDSVELVFDFPRPFTTAVSRLVDEMPEWTDNHIGYGHSYIYLKLKYDKDAFTRGMPNVSAVVRGKKVFDPRINANVYSDNHALVTLDYILDPYGLNAELDEVDLDSFAAGADVCDEQVAGVDGGTEPRYTVNGTLEFSANPIDNLNSLRKAGQCTLNYEQGTWQYVAGVYSEPVVDLDESDLVGGISVMTGPSKADLINTVKGSFLDPRQDYEVVQYPEISISEYVTRDKEKLTGEVSAPFSVTATHARRVGKINIEQTRFGVRMQATFKWSAIELLPGDRVTFSSERLGWDKKIFRIVGGGQSITLTGGIDLTLAEDGPSVWDWQEGDALDVDIPPALNLPDANITKPFLLSATEELYSTNVQNIIKTRVTLTWERGGVRSTYFNVQARKSGETEFKELASYWSGTEYTIEDSELGEYEYRVQGVTDIGRLSEWTTISYTVLGKNAPPSDVPELSAVQKSYGVDISWQAVADPDVLEYELRLDENFGQSGSLYTGRQLRFTDIRREDGVTYYVKAIDTSGNYSLNSSSFTPSIMGPQQTGSLVVTSQDNYVELRWASSESVYPIAYYRLRKGPLFDGAEVLGEVTGTFHLTKEANAGTFTYWVQPVDVSGAVGTPRSSLASVDVAQDYILRADDLVNFADMDTLDNVAIGSGGGGLRWDDTQLRWDDADLRWDDGPSLDLIGPVNNTETFIENMQRSGLTTDPLLAWDNETQPWDDETLGWDLLGGDPYGKKIDNGFTHWLDPSLPSGEAEKIIDLGALIPSTRITVLVDYEDLRAGANLVTTISTSQDGVSWDMFPADQLEVTSANFRYLRINHLFDATGGNGIIRINSVRYKLDIKQKTDQGQAEVFAADATGTEVLLNKPFIDIDSVVATPKAIDAKIAVTTFDDVGNQDRFLVRVFDRATGNRVDATISWQARGS